MRPRPRHVLPVLLTLGLSSQTPLPAQESRSPSNLPEAKRIVLDKFLAEREKPKKFLPPRFTIQSAPGTAAAIDLDPPGEVREFLSAIVPHRDASRADVYFFRPNPKKGTPGVTVKQTIDLTTGKVGDPTVLTQYPAPLTREEEAAAVALARAGVPAVAALYAAGGDVRAAALLETVTAPGLKGRMPGDRVVTLQFRKKGGRGVTTAAVNLTKDALLNPND